MGASLTSILAKGFHSLGSTAGRPDLSTLDTEGAHHFRIVDSMLSAAVFLCLPFSAFYWGFGGLKAAGAFWAAAAGFWLCRKWLRATLNSVWTGRFGCGVFFLLLVWSFFNLGGFRSPVNSWILIMPVASTIIMGIRDGWFWVGVVGSTAFAFWHFERAGWVPGNLVDPAAQPYADLFFRVSPLIAIGVLTSVWVSTQHNLFQRLRASLANQEHEAAKVRLLLDTTVTSNQSLGMRDATRRILEAVCNTLDWEVGHAWLRESDRYELAETFLATDCPEHRVMSGRASRLDPELGEGLAGRALKSGRLELVDACSADPADFGDEIERAGLRAGFAFPVECEGQTIAILEFFGPHATDKMDDSPAVMTHVATQLVYVHERERSHAAIQKMAYHDALTGLSNRRAFQERLEQALSHARARGRRVGVLFVDIDRFKTVNDSFGHNAGDQLLVEVSQSLKSCLRMSDHLSQAWDQGTSISRIGGDEFIILLSEIGTARDAETVAQRVLRQIDSDSLASESGGKITLSIGVAIFPEDGEVAEELLRSADAAMYEAKREDRNAYRFSTASLNEQVTRRIQIERGLKTAVERGEMSLVYQPVVRCSDLEIIGGEALLRWENEQLGQISPGHFIPIAEESPAILTIGEWVLERSLEKVVEWNRARPVPLRINVNVSARQLRVPGFPDLLKRCLLRTGCEPEWVELELTERAIMGEDPRVVAVLDEVRVQGVSLALDDFGTGYSSLANMKHLPIDRLKIDKGFVSALPFDASDVSITTAIISLAHNSGMSVVAEGVETQEQLDFLVEHGCDEMQGYYLGRPEPELPIAKKAKT